MFFRTVPTANTLVRWVNENAFAPIVRARPCPTFGRPVHRRGSPHRLRPGTSPHTLRIPPHGGHPVLRSNTESGFRFTLAVSSFRFRARLGFSIPSLFSGQRGITPAFGYSAPHPGAGGTLTLLNSALLSAHYTAVRLLEDVHVGCTAVAFSHRPDCVVHFRYLRGLPVLVRGVSRRAWGLRLRGTDLELALTSTAILPSALTTTSASRLEFSGARYPAHLFPCLRFSGRLATPTAKLGAEWLATPFS